MKLARLGALFYKQSITKIISLHSSLEKACLLVQENSLSHPPGPLEKRVAEEADGFGEERKLLRTFVEEKPEALGVLFWPVLTRVFVRFSQFLLRFVSQVF